MSVLKNTEKKPHQRFYLALKGWEEEDAAALLTRYEYAPDVTACKMGLIRLKLTEETHYGLRIDVASGGKIDFPENVTVIEANVVYSGKHKEQSELVRTQNFVAEQGVGSFISKKWLECFASIQERQTATLIAFHGAGLRDIRCRIYETKRYKA